MPIYDWQNCESVSSIDEYEVMDEIVSLYHKELNRDLFCLEVGSYRGQSTVLLAQYGTVFAIDLWADIHDGTANIDKAGQTSFLEFMETMQRFGLIAEQRVFPILGTSLCADFFPPGQCDVIYIDGSHYYEPAKLDIQHTKSRLSTDGLYLFHDYKRQGDRPGIGVNQAIDELLQEGEFIIQEHFHGLACLRRIREVA